LYTVSTMHCMTVSLAQDGEGLGAMWGEQKALELLAEVGLPKLPSGRSKGTPSTTSTLPGSINKAV